MKRVVTLSSLVLALVVALGLVSEAEQRAAATPFFFVQLTDPQLGMFADNANIDQEVANLEFAVATINRLRPAFVVVTGDLVNRAGDEEQIGAYVRTIGKVDRAIPVYNLPGNPDVGNTPTPDSLAAWVKHFGPDHYVFHHATFTGIVLNSVLLHDPSKAPDVAAEQERWLRAQLERSRADGSRHVVIFQHHPYFALFADEPDVYENIPRVRRAKYLALFEEFGVKHVFAGHYHGNAVSKAGSLEMVTTGPIGMPLGEKSKSGLRIVTVTDAGLEHRYYDLGELPHRVQVGR